MASTPITGIYNITCYQGVTLKRMVNWTDSAKNTYDLSGGYKAHLQVRSSETSNTVIADLTNYAATATTVGSTALGSYTFSVAINANIVVGQVVVGTGIPSNSVIKTITTSGSNYIVTLSNATTAIIASGSTLTFGYIALASSSPNITIYYPATSTTNIATGTYIYDLLLTAPNGDIDRIIGGNFIVKAKVTR